MRPILTIVSNDLRIFFSQRGNLVGLLVIPVLLTVVIGWSLGQFVGGGQARLRVDLIDLDGSGMSAHLIDELRATNSALVLCPLDNDADDFCRLDGEELALEGAIERARGGRTEALIVVPAGYATALKTFQRASIDYYSMSDPLQPDLVLQSLEAVLQRVNGASMTAGVAEALLDNVTAGLDLPAVTETVRRDFLDALYRNAEQKLIEIPAPVSFEIGGEEAGDDASVNGFNQSAPGMGSLYVMFTVLGGMAVLLRERRQWTLQRLMALPLSRGADPWKQDCGLLCAGHDSIYDRVCGRWRRGDGLR